MASEFERQQAGFRLAIWGFSLFLVLFLLAVLLIVVMS